VKRSGKIRRSTRFDYVQERRRKWNKTQERVERESDWEKERKKERERERERERESKRWKLKTKGWTNERNNIIQKLSISFNFCCEHNEESKIIKI
jgi:hypothetical protein